MRVYALIAFAVLLVGCATPKPNPAAYGPPPEREFYEAKINEWLHNNLRDPFSAHIEIGQPEKYFAEGGLVHGNKLYQFWNVTARVNSKNGFGGYSGWTPYYFAFKDGAMISAGSRPPYYIELK